MSDTNCVQTSLPDIANRCRPAGRPTGSYMNLAINPISDTFANFASNSIETMQIINKLQSPKVCCL